MELLPCGHTQHSEAEESQWKSPEFAKETQRQKDLARELVTELKAKKRLHPGPYPPIPYTYENCRLYEVKNHFAYMKRRLLRAAYLQEVAIYERALSDFFALPPCRRALRSFLLSLPEVPGLLQPKDVQTPRTGGRHPSQTIQRRNSRIAELVKAHGTHLNICLTLDAEKWPVPPEWRKDGIQTWRQAYKRVRNRVHSLISKASTKKVLS